MISLPKEPQSIGKVLDTGFRLYTKSLKQAFILAAIPSIIGGLPYLAAGVMPNIAGGPDFMKPGIMVALVIFIIAAVVINLTFYNGIIFRIWGIATSKDPGFTESIAQGLRLFFPVLFGSILYALAIMIGSVLLIIPGIILMLSLMFYSVLIVTKRETSMAALKHSHRLVWGNWWRTMIIFTVPAIIAVVLFSVVSFAEVSLLAAMADISPEHPDFETTFNFYYSMINVVVNGLLMPMYVSVMLANFNDLTLRKEGSDIHERIDAAIESA